MNAVVFIVFGLLLMTAATVFATVLWPWGLIPSIIGGCLTGWGVGELMWK